MICQAMTSGHATNAQPTRSGLGLGFAGSVDEAGSNDFGLAATGRFTSSAIPGPRKWCRSLGFPESQMQPATCRGQDRYLNS
jgi:hypothetical protein